MQSEAVFDPAESNSGLTETVTGSTCLWSVFGVSGAKGSIGHFRKPILNSKQLYSKQENVHYLKV